MVKASFFKTVNRMFRKNLSRFFSLLAIVFIGICFVTGVGGISDKIRNSYNEYFHFERVSDIVLKSKSTQGFLPSDIEKLDAIDGIEEKLRIVSIDLKEEEVYNRYCVYPFEENGLMNTITVVEGRFPQNGNECVVEESSSTLEKVELNSTLSFMMGNYNVVGIVRNPLIFAMDGEVSVLEDSFPVKRIAYFDKEFFTLPLPVTDLYLKVETTRTDYFSSGYFKDVDKVVNSIKNVDGFSSSEVETLTLKKNKSYALLDNITKKVDVIAFAFPVFFILVVALVVLTTVTRMIDEERSTIGCYISLGYRSSLIISKYLSFTLIATLLGVAAGLGIGAFLLPNIIAPAFGSVFILPTLSSQVSLLVGSISGGAMFLAVAAISIYVYSRTANEAPYSLFIAKAPKPGKKILLERITFLWKRLKFKYKSSYRNIFRYVGRLLMVVISVAGSTAITMAGFGLKDISGTSIKVDGFEIDISETLSMISIVIIIFALCLCGLVVYNLMNMDIAEKKREIATLKVLGYLPREVDGYVFREIGIMSLFGIIIGVPLGTGLLFFIFYYLDFGSISSVNWSSYLLSGGLVLLIVVLVSIALIPKINRVDMNESLKSLE